MKVRFEDEYKRFYTVEEYEQAQKVIAYEKENDSFTPKDWADMALNTLCYARKWSDIRIVEASAKTAKHTHIACRDWYGDETGYMDVRINALAEIYDDTYRRAFVEISCYLTDVAQCGDDEKFNVSMIEYTVFTRKG